MNGRLFCLKILVLLLVDRSYAVNNGPNSSIITNPIYKQILKMRTLPFEDCGSIYDVLYVGTSSCTTIPCQMKRNTVVKVNVIFDDNGDNTSYLKHEVRWIFNAVNTDALITPDPCDGDHSCLVSASDGKSYYANVFVSNVLPTVRGTMKWEAVNGKQQKAICFKLPVLIIP